MIPKFILDWWETYKAEKKRKELYARLDRNASGKFDMKEHRKQIVESKKKMQKKKADIQKDLKE